MEKQVKDVVKELLEEYDKLHAAFILDVLNNDNCRTYTLEDRNYFKFCLSSLHKQGMYLVYSHKSKSFKLSNKYHAMLEKQQNEIDQLIDAAFVIVSD